MSSSLALRQLVLSTSRRPQDVIARQRLCADCYNASLARALRSSRSTHSRALANYDPSLSQQRRPAQSVSSHFPAWSYHIQNTYRGMATTRATSQGPMGEYDARVRNGKLRDDPHQRSTSSLSSLSHHVLIARRSAHSKSTRPSRYAPRL